MIKKTLKRIPINFFLLPLFSLSAFSVQADFDYPGNGTLTYPTGTQTPFEFGFAFKKGEEGYFFKVGKQQMDVNDVPEKYSIWLTLKNDEHVWVQEFAKGYFQSFDWQLGDHKVSLNKKVFSKKRSKADYVLTIDDIDYYFMNNNGQIEISFTRDGIKSITTEGFVKGIGVKE